MFERLLEDLGFQCLLAEQPLQLAHLALQSPIIRGRHHLFAAAGSRQRPLHHQPAPGEQLVMGWTRRAPAPPSRKAGSGYQNQEHSMARNTSRLEAIATIGIDIGKNTFHVVGLDRNGAIVLRQKLSRRQVEARLANMPPCLIGMEACVGAHHLSRQLKALGHDARLMPARYVRPYSKGQKNDFRDAEAIAEAVLRPTMKFVAIKTVEQLDLQALHRIRER